MKINIYSHLDDPAKIDGFTIVIDVFRAFTVAYYVWENNPDRYIITNSVDHALELKKRSHNPVLIGERDGVKVPGFDYGNSPTAIQDKDFSRCTVIHTTTAGTKGVLDQPAQNEVIVGSFVNKDAMLKYVSNKGIQTVNLFCTAPPGWGDEDYLFAKHFRKLLLGEKSDFADIVEELRVGSGLRLLQSKTEPAADFDYSLQRNRFDAILTRKYIPDDNNALELVEIDTGTTTSTSKQNL